MFSALINVISRELRTLGERTADIIILFLMPIFWIAIAFFLTGDGIVTNVPVAFVDQDNTSLSREVGRAFDANRAFGLISYANQPEAIDALKAGKVYAVIEIPFNYTKDHLRGIGSPIVMYLDENRYAVAATLQSEATTIVQALESELSMKVALATGSSISEAERILKALQADFYAVGNPQNSFIAFLGSTLMPGVLMLSAILTFVTSLVRENYSNSISDWLSTAHGSYLTALTGKLIPYFVYYSLLLAAYIGLLAGISGFKAAGSLWLWFACGLACLAVMSAMAVLFVGISPTWRFALVVTSGYAAPALAFSGFSLPLDSMGPLAALFAQCLPLTWFIEGQAQEWIFGANISQMRTTFLAFGLMWLIPTLLGLPAFIWNYNRIRNKEGAQT